MRVLRAAAGRHGRLGESSGMNLQPTLPFVPWKDTHGKHLCHALRKPHMSPLIGQSASVSERLSVRTPIPQHTVEISLGEMTLQQVPVLTALSKGQRPLLTQWSGTRSYFGESFDLFCSALVPEPTVLQAG